MSEESSIKLWTKLSQYTFDRMEHVKSNGIKFVHYTSAANALSIIQKNEVWMRNSSVMNDFSEVQHGQRCLQSAWNDQEQGTRLKRLLDAVESGLADRLARSFDERQHDRARESFMISFSEHGQGVIDEDKYGRLSMWRAYGGNTNVAIVMNNKPFFNESSATNAYTTPIYYGDTSMFVSKFKNTVDALESNFDLARGLGGDTVKVLFENTFHFAALSTKHPGFAEEREWRVILSPTMYPSEKLAYDIEVIHGVPQKVYKFPLVDFPEEGHTGVTLPDLIEEIIIGPTDFSYTIFDALGDALVRAGVSDGFDRVSVSHIPLRR